jgi:hypothetical protein
VGPEHLCHDPTTSELLSERSSCLRVPAAEREPRPAQGEKRGGVPPPERQEPVRRDLPERADRRVMNRHRVAMGADLLESIGDVIEIDGRLEPQ